MSRRTEYVELHLHTGHSFRDGASLPDEMVLRAAALGYRALAIADHDGLHGAMEFAKLADDHGITPITGAELTLTDGSHLTLLAETQTGYANLCQLLTEAHRERAEWDAATEGEAHGVSPNLPALSVPFALRGIGKPTYRYRKGERRPRLDPGLLQEYAEGLILLTGCRQAKLAQLVDSGQPREAEAVLRDYVTWFGSENVFVELQQNFVYGDTARIHHLIQLADSVGVRYVATGNVHYHSPERHRLQDVPVAIRHRATLDASHRERRPNAQSYLRSPEKMTRLFARYPNAIDATVEIAKRCARFNLARDLAYTFPDYDTASAETPDEMLSRVCHQALA